MTASILERQSKIFEGARTDKQLHGLAFRNPTLRLAPFYQTGNYEVIFKRNKERDDENLGPPHVFLNEKVVHIEHSNDE